VQSASHEGARGDQIVTVQVVIPHLKDEKSKEIMREFGRLNPEDPRSSIFNEI
jgi:molecular chaperone DnaJ